MYKMCDHSGGSKKIARMVQANRRRDGLYTKTLFGETLWLIGLDIKCGRFSNQNKMEGTRR